LVPAVTQAMHKAIDEMGDMATFRGYGPEQGYDFLRKAIAENDYHLRGVDISEDEIFVSDGAKCDVGNIQELFGKNTIIAITDPVYPVYVDTNVMAGRSGMFNSEKQAYENFVYLPTIAENCFVPDLPQEKIDVLYLCYPNNPTGAALTKDQLKVFVDYARKNKTLILFDAAYEAFITEPNVPHSIFEIEGARECAIEFRSFSKTAGFTGTRCAFTVIPKELKYEDDLGNTVSLHAMWNRRHSTKFNGVSYITQRGAEAIYSPEGKKQISENIQYYLDNAKILRDGMKEAGYATYGGVNSPYVWVKTPCDSWTFFDQLLMKAHVVGTPGSGFGVSGEGYFRMTAFATRENTMEAIQRIKKM